MNDLASYRPRKERIMVGDKEMAVNEYVIAKRDAVFSIVLSAVDVAQLFKPFLDGIRELKKELTLSATEGKTEEKKKEADIDLGEVFAKLKDTAQKILTKELSLITCVTLDVPENRVVVEIDSNVVETNPDHGFEYSPHMFKWIKEHITQRQEQAMFGAVINVNDIEGLLKNYKSLITNRTTAVGEETE